MHRAFYLLMPRLVDHGKIRVVRAARAAAAAISKLLDHD
jgi:hypothetical protein